MFWFVPEQSKKYDIENGLMGLGRDTFFRLFRLYTKKANGNYGEIEKKIRNVIGISQKHLEWVKHRYFVRTQAVFMKFPVLFQPTENIITSTPTGPCCFFGNDWSDVLFDSIIEQGCYHWAVEILYARKCGSSVRIGAVSARGQKFRRGFLGCSDKSFALTCRGTSEGSLSYLEGVVLGDMSALLNFVPHGSVVSIEVDMRTRTACFFVDGKKMAHAVQDICCPLVLGAAGCHFAAFRSVTFTRLTRPTPSPVVVRFYKPTPLYSCRWSRRGDSDMHSTTAAPS